MITISMQYFGDRGSSSGKSGAGASGESQERERQLNQSELKSIPITHKEV